MLVTESGREREGGGGVLNRQHEFVRMLFISSTVAVQLYFLHAPYFLIKSTANDIFYLMLFLES